MAHPPDDAARFAADGRTGVVRLKMPREGSLVIADGCGSIATTSTGAISIT